MKYLANGIAEETEQIIVVNGGGIGAALGANNRRGGDDRRREAEEINDCPKYTRYYKNIIIKKKMVILGIPKQKLKL